MNIMQIIRLGMITSLIITILFITVAFSGDTVKAGDGNVFFREDFNDLDDWKPLYFPKIKEHSLYSIEKGEGAHLKAESNASASGIIYKEEFNVYNYPKVKWRWKVDNVYEMGDARKKSGDDYPLRIYIMFKYDPEKASFGKKIKYGIAKKLYGEYPPDSSLNYIWANKKHKERVIANTYTSAAMMILLQSGGKNVDKWVEQEVDVLEDYRKAFGEDPPSVASIAVMNDSDNTKESSVSYVDYIEVFKQR
ncbi:hypothetical protein BMS3Abin09_00758 [bacterium BMS3Abin09]|nr:hypothetical protein BMS3Abin09_00758 [bacterium BMS3Abin09]GBE41545.1 hypothetical protein BMS3Bbin09_01450 [bacterium BMS3Bbin09]